MQSDRIKNNEKYIWFKCLWTKGLTYLQYVLLFLKHDFNHLIHSIKYRTLRKLYLHSGRAALKETGSVANILKKKVLWTGIEISLKGCNRTDFIVLLVKDKCLVFPCTTEPFWEGQTDSLVCAPRNSKKKPKTLIGVPFSNIQWNSYYSK